MSRKIEFKRGQNALMKGTSKFLGGYVVVKNSWLSMRERIVDILQYRF